MAAIPYRSEFHAIGLRPADRGETPHLYCKKAPKSYGCLVVQKPERFINAYTACIQGRRPIATRAQLIANLPAYGNLVADIDIRCEHDVDRHRVMDMLFPIIHDMSQGNVIYLAYKKTATTTWGVHLFWERLGTRDERFHIADTLNAAFEHVPGHTIKADKVYSLWLSHVAHKTLENYYTIVGACDNGVWIKRDKLVHDPTRLRHLVTSTTVVFNPACIMNDTRRTPIAEPSPTKACCVLPHELRMRMPSDVLAQDTSSSYVEHTGGYLFKLIDHNKDRQCPKCAKVHHSFYWLFFRDPKVVAHLRCSKCGTVMTLS